MSDIINKGRVLWYEIHLHGKKIEQIVDFKEARQRYLDLDLENQHGYGIVVIYEVYACKDVYGKEVAIDAEDISFDMFEVI